MKDKMVQRKLIRLAALLAPVALVGCSLFSDAEDIQKTVSGQPKVSFEALRAKDPQAQLGAREHPKIVQGYGGVYESAKIEQMLAPIAGALVTYSDDPERAYDITVLNSPTVNAFALPGGYLYITRGLLALANDQAEIAAVLAHEIAHVSSNHGIARSNQAKAATIADRVVSEVVTHDMAGKVAKANAKRRLARFSQEQELQADAQGIKLIGKAGYDPFAAARFLEAMEDYSAWQKALKRGDDDMSSSHPSTPRRIELAKRHARAVGPQGSGQRNRDRYLSGINGMTFGDTAKEGFVRGNAFSHKALNITFSVPADFTLTNRAEAVLASGPNQSALRFDAASARKIGNPVDYLKSGWVNGLDPASVQAFSQNGMDGAKGRAIAGDWQFEISALKHKNRYFRFILASPKSGPALSDIAASITRSFREMSVAERNALKPLRIKVVSVSASDTIASLAAKMGGVSRKVQLFKALNGLKDGQRLKAGDRVKLVVG